MTTRVGYQGEPGAFSEQAARAHFADAEPVGCATFRDVFDQVAAGRVAYGVIPIENSIMGSILQNYDLLLEYDARIVGEHKLRVAHHLIAHPGVSMGEIARLYVHPAAAAQCERFLRAHAGWSVFQSYDTAGAVRMIRDQRLRDAAAVASEQAARVYGMAVLQAGIEDHPENYTRFVVIAREERRPEEGNKTSLAFATKNRPGALFETLRPFAERGINLTKIESRPIQGRPWEYLFYVDIEGNAAAPDVAEALAALRRHTQYFRMLGCYRAA